MCAELFNSSMRKRRALKNDKRRAPPRTARDVFSSSPAQQLLCDRSDEEDVARWEIEAMLANVRKFGLQGGPGVMAEVWDQMTIYRDEAKADEAERRGVEVIRAEAYL